MSVFLLILGIFLAVCLIIFHELGHFLAARRGGVETEEFGIGFPPRIWGKQLRQNKGDNTLYSVNLLPIGGFVRLKGEHDNDREKGSFGAASLKRKIIIMLAGVGMNFLAAAVILTVLAFIGIPKIVDNQFWIKSDAHSVDNKVSVGFVESGSPADRAGLRKNDQLISLGGTKVSGDDQLRQLTHVDAGRTVEMIYKQNGTTVTRSVTLNKSDNNNQGYLGVSTLTTTSFRATWSAPIVGIVTTAQLAWLTLKLVVMSIFWLIIGHGAQASANVAGPVGIFEILKLFSHLGFNFILMIVADISIALGVANLLPIPALDGGSLYLILFYRLRKKALSSEKEEKIKMAGMAILLALMIIITIVDIRRF